MKNDWICKPFSQLTPEELYAVLRLRISVFIVEQNCIFQDADNNDQQAWHLMLYENGILVAYSRLFAPGIMYPQSSIGRILTDSQFRNKNFGRLLLKESIGRIYSLFGTQDIQIGAQLYLKKFYESFGFRQFGEIYDEDGIDHIHMIKAYSTDPS